MQRIRAISSKRAAAKEAARTIALKDASAYPPKLSAISASASEQSQSPFFSKLPPEIRLMVYTEVWRFSGLTQHWFNDPTLSVTKRCSAPCVVEHDDPEPYMDWINDADADARIQSWVHLCQVLLPTQSPWKNHWLCRESAKSSRWRQPLRVFLPLLLCCRKSYIECRASIAETITFVLHDNLTTLSFLMNNPPPILNDLKRLQISLNFTTYEMISRNPQWHHSHWSLICKRLAELDRLEHVAIRLHAADNFQVNHFARIKLLYDDIPERLRSKATVNVPVDPEEEYEGFENPSLNMPRDSTLAPPEVRLLRRGNPRLERFGAMTNVFDEVELRNGVINGTPARRSEWVLALRGFAFCFCLFPAMIIVAGSEAVKQVREWRHRRRVAHPS